MANPTILQVMEDPALLGQSFTGVSWDNWRVFLKVLFGEKLSHGEMEVYTKFTGRQTLPRQVEEAAVVAGRRAVKSLIASFVALYLACFKDHRPYLAPGEYATIMLIAADRQQARIILNYLRGFFDNVALLASQAVQEGRECSGGQMEDVVGSGKTLPTLKGSGIVERR